MAGRKGKLRDDDKLPQFERGSDDFFAERSHVVLVRVSDFLNQAVRAESLQQARHLPAVDLRQMAAERFVLQSADIELAANDRTQQSFIIRVEQVEAGVATAFQFHRLGEFVEPVPARARIFDRRKELQIAPVGSRQQFAQRGKAVDAFLRRRPLDATGAVAMFYLAVVLEKGQIVDRGLDPKV